MVKDRFKRRRSCLTNLIKFFHGIIIKYNNHKAIEIENLDFKRAFYLVSHKRLIR